MKTSLLAALCLAASCGLPPEVLPPPFGPEHPQDPRLFFPTGLASTSAGALLVSNGNFNHAYDAGTVVSLAPDFVAAFFRKDPSVAGSPLSCDLRSPPAGCDRPLRSDASAVMIGNYAGPLVLNSAGTAAYTASRDSGLLNAVSVDASGNVSCPPGVGRSSTDCRGGLVDLKAGARLDGPYNIVPGNYVPIGQADRRSVFFVSSVVPHIESITSGSAVTSSQVAALDMGDPRQILFAVPVALSPLIANGTAPGPMAFDAVQRRLYLAGCYERFGATGAGEPGSGKCVFGGINLLRVVEVDAQGSAQARLYNLYADVRSIETTQILLAEPDPVTGAPHALWATMRNPDMLVRVELPAQLSTPPRVTRAVPLAIAPADMTRIQRPGAADLIAVISERSGTLALYDTGLDQVVGQVERLGNQPFTLAQLPCPPKPDGNGTDSACLAATVFNECRVAFVEVPLAQPWTATLRGRAGGCL